MPRLTNEFECEGCPDNAKGCGKVFGSESLRTQHHNKGKPNYRCPVPVCSRTYTQKSYLHKHIRKEHPERMDELNIKPVRIQLPVPTKYEERKDEWRFVKKQVTTNITRDKKKMEKWNTEDQKFLKENFDDKSKINQAKHDITLLIMELLDKSELLKSGSTDTLGGILPDGLKLQQYGGLFQMSGDRLDNNRPHYIPGEDMLGNLQFIPMAFNCPSNIAGDYRENFCSFLRTVIRSQHFFPKNNKEIQDALEKESKSCRVIKGKQVNNKLYQCCLNIWNSKREKKVGKVKLSFKTLTNFFDAMKKMLRNQKCRCILSDIFLLGITDRARHPFGMSIDAIEPCKGHVKGNLRIICWFMNSTNHDNSKKRQDPNDGQSSWDRQSFQRYIGL